MIDEKRSLKPGSAKGVTANPKRLTSQALSFWGGPTLSAATRGALISYARSAAVTAATEAWQREQYPVLALNALRALVVASPDYHTC
jgi:hypothetical protein